MCIWTFWYITKIESLKKAFVLANGGKVSEIDPSMCTWHKNNSIVGVIIVHVGDFLFADNKKLQNIV